MKKYILWFLSFVVLGVAGLAVGGVITKPFTFSSATLIQSSQVNSNFDTIYTEFNGGISNANISASAAIAQSKISNLQVDLASKVNDTGDTLSGGLNVKMNAPFYRFIGTEASAQDLLIVEFQGDLYLQKNTATEASPSWVTLLRLPTNAGAPSIPEDLTRKDYVDGNIAAKTSGLAVGQVVKTDGDTEVDTSWVDIPSLSTTITTGAHRARVSLSAAMKNDTGGGRDMNVRVLVDGNVFNGGVLQTNAGGGVQMNVSFSNVTTALSAGSHTFKVQAQTNNSSGAVTLVGNAMWPAQLTVEELPY